MSEERDSQRSERDHRRELDLVGRHPVEAAADLFIFAPLGLLLEARRLWPELVDRGRDQLGMAREDGDGAASHPDSWLARRLDASRSEAVAALRGLGLPPRPGQDARPPRTDAEPKGNEQRASAPPIASKADVPVIDVATLPIPEYDHLSASQVVPRLDGLDDGELELVRCYEVGNRGRNTILSKIAQLQSG